MAMSFFLEIWIEYPMSDSVRIFYALLFCYIHFLLFFRFQKQITELNVYLSVSINEAPLIVSKI